MEVLVYCKLHICLLVVLSFVSYLFIRDGNRLNRKTKVKKCNHLYDYLFVLGEVALLLDGLTYYMVNNLDKIPDGVNTGFHLAYLLVYQWFIFVHFLYWLKAIDMTPKSIMHKVFCSLPVIISSLVTIIFISKIEYKIGEYTNYSSGVPAFACFASIILYSILTLIVFLIRKNYILKNKRTAFVMALVVTCVITLVQILFNEALVSSIALIIIILSIYLCMENPSIKFLEFYHDEMIMGFATLVENKDGSTGGHIHRTSAYAVLIATELRKNPKYKSIITKDYIMDINKAAPMHDIGKIGIPDKILQKPGKLTFEEYEQMKEHTNIGAKIIEETFGHLDDEDYEKMAYDVAIGHHEKWNGNGYPNHLKSTEIPLCARIMAVADVFDAISSKRCYHEAMSLDECYKILSDGRNSDFDPDVIDAFFSCQKKIEAVYNLA